LEKKQKERANSGREGDSIYSFSVFGTRRGPVGVTVSRAFSKGRGRGKKLEEKKTGGSLIRMFRPLGDSVRTGVGGYGGTSESLKGKNKRE